MVDDSETPAHALDDEADRKELRDRYYGLMQELRIVLPGVQFLGAFLLTVPFAQRFSEVDDVGRVLFGLALASAILSAVAFITPTALHRFGERTARAERLALSILMMRAGLLLLGVALTLSLTVVARFLYDTAMAVVLVAVVATGIVGLWVVLPLATRRK
ncbi:MAG: DUF6328 family protein [Acidimicrobiia bacterium]